MSVRLYTHPACLEHDPGSGHPESPARLRVHDGAYVDAVFAAAPAHGMVRLDPDTVMSPGSLEAALRAAGAACAAVDDVMRGETRRAFCAVRPPGHHATRHQAMGFCLFDTVAVAAAHALEAHGLERVAIADFDVHHGNGTQAIFWRDPRVVFASSHQMPLYPGTGAAGERGAGNIFNAPLAPGAGSTEFREAWDATMLPAIDAFRPQLLLVSAGFDAHARDPLAQLQLAAGDYGWITQRLCGIAGAHADGRVVSTLEGGYDLAALAESAAAHVAALMA